MGQQVSEKKLEEEYEALGKSFLNVLSDFRTYERLRISIIKYCLEEDLPLYNLAPANFRDGNKLLKELIEIFSLGQYINKSRLNQWKEKFEVCLKSMESLTREEHASAYTCIKDQHQRLGEIPNNTLLNYLDLKALLDDELFSSSTIQKSDIIELPDFAAEEAELSSRFFGAEDEVVARQLKRGTENLIKDFSEEIEAQLRALITQDKDIFIPLAHQGHWVSLVREKGVWSVYDSQPYNEDKPLDRQVFIRTNCAILLTKYDNNFSGLTYKSTEKQSSFFDCGTHVVNDWRKRVNKDYVERTHEEMLREAGEKQGVVVNIVPPRPAVSTVTFRNSSSRSRLFDDRLPSLREKSKKRGKEKEREKDNGAGVGDWEDYTGVLGEDYLGPLDEDYIPVEVTTNRRPGSDSLGSFHPFDITNDKPLNFSRRKSRHRKDDTSTDLQREPVSFMGSAATRDDRSSSSSAADLYTTDNYAPIPKRDRQINAQEKKRIEQIDEQIRKIENVLITLKAKQDEYKLKKESFEKTEFANEDERVEYDKEREKYVLAELHAQQLHDGVEVALSLFKQTAKEFSDYRTFRDETNRLISEHKSPLSTHRDLSNICICNALLGLVLGFYTIYLAIMAASYVFSNRTSYFWRTDAERKIYDLEDATDELGTFYEPK